jgi:recombination protein RecA
MGTLLQISSALSPSEELRPERPGLPRQAGESRARKAAPRWNLEALAGAMAEISAPGPAAGVLAAVRLLLDAQERGEPAAWIVAGDSLPYAPDLSDAGIDLEALPFVRVTGTVAGARAAEHLLRSGAFGFVILDLTVLEKARRSGTALHPAAQMRLAALCRRHQAGLLLLARKPEGAPPIASLASMRAQGTVRRTAFDRFTFQLQVLKDKRQGTGWSHEEICRGPDGLC